MEKGSIGHAFTVCIHTENQNQTSFCPPPPKKKKKKKKSLKTGKHPGLIKLMGKIVNFF